MKIRIKGNSVRFRLAQNEVTELVETGQVWNTCDFITGRLVYGIIATDESKITCAMNGNRIICNVPSTLLPNWDTDQRVGFDHRTDDLYILIEKDWQCLKPRAHEDESNLYTNPQA